MPDKSTTPWPALPPETGPNTPDTSRRVRVAGQISIALAIIGVIALVAACRALASIWKGPTGGYMVDVTSFHSTEGTVTFALVFSWSVLAVVAGLMGKSSVTGKIGLLLALAVAGVSALLVVMFV